jgi:hypothetical protein
MYRNRDFDLQQALPWNEQALTQDLELTTLWSAMSSGDEFLFDVARKAVLTGVNNDIDTILYRQNVLSDCMNNPSVIKSLYGIAVDAIAHKKKPYWGIFSFNYPSSILSTSVEVMQMFVDNLKKIRAIADENAGNFKSEGFTALFAMLKKELDDEYFGRVQQHLHELNFPDGILLSAELGKGNKATNYILHKLFVKKKTWLQWLMAGISSISAVFGDKVQRWIKRIFKIPEDNYTFEISSHDEGGIRALSELKNKGINLVANALAQSNDHILGFLTMMQTELAFYIGCLNLQQQLVSQGETVSFPVPMPSGEYKHAFKGLYDVCLSLTMKQKITGNDVNADHKNLVIITGANRGGKTTFLRSIGLSQLMMQCGMFVAADSFSANICDSLITHYRREEDTTMQSGKLDEEFSRMSGIAEHITSDTMLLFNESFAATNEREGSEIARQIVSALLEKRIKIFFVTHLYEFAHSFYVKGMGNAIFLRAERGDETIRTFKLAEGEPLQTSFGEDLYNKIFTNTD